LLLLPHPLWVPSDLGEDGPLMLCSSWLLPWCGGFHLRCIFSMSCISRRGIRLGWKPCLARPVPMTMTPRVSFPFLEHHWEAVVFLSFLVLCF
jgi:hypothetical protein